MPHPAEFDNDVRSPYDAGLSYFQDEYSTGAEGAGDASRLGFAFVAIPAAVKGATALISAAQNLFGGGARDADRLKRVQWFQDAALNGSVLAGQVILAGPDNVASHEDPMWIDAANVVRAQRPDVWSAAVSAGKWWPTTDAETQRVVDELNSLATAGRNASAAVSNVTGIGSGSSSVAASAALKSGLSSILGNPVILAAGVGGLALLLTSKRRRR